MNPYPNPADHPEAQGFLKWIAEHPGDNLGRLQFADWLEDNDYHNASAGQRWAAKYNKTPYVFAPVDDGSGYKGWAGYGHSADHTLATHYMPKAFAARNLPHAGAYGVNPLWLNRDPDRFPHEVNLLRTMHQLDWHPETGEPIDPSA